MKKSIVALLFTIAASPFAFAQSATNLEVTKTGPPQAPAGSDISYTVTVANLSGVDAAVVTLTDAIPDGMTFVSAAPAAGFTCSTPAVGATGTVTCTSALLAAGASGSFTFVFHVTAPGTIRNTATVTSQTPDSNPGNNSSSVDTRILAMDLQVTKTGPAEAAAGTNVSYTVTVANLGDLNADFVTVEDNIPPGMTFVSATAPAGFTCSTPAVGDPGLVSCSTPALAAGASASFTFVFAISGDAAPGTVFTNFATANSETADANEENNTGVAVTSTPPPPRGDLGVTKSGPPSATPDSDVTFTITLFNAGPSAAETVVLTDNLPAPLTFVSFTQNSGPTMSCGTSTCTLASFPALATATFTLVGHVPANTQGGTQITNTATVSSTNDVNEENNSAATTLVVSTADVSVTKSGPASVLAGDDVAYTLTVTNNGPDAALDVTLSDVIPAATSFVSLTPVSGPGGTCSVNGTVSCFFSVLTNGQSATYTLVLRAGDTTSITNTATASTASVDPDPTDNSSTVNTNVTPQADLAVTKSGPSGVTAGTNISWNLTLTNAGASTAQNVTLTDTLPAGTTFVSINQTTGPAFPCNHAAGVITCTRATFAPQTTATFTVTASVALTTTGSITNAVTVTTTTTDPNSSNNSATAIAAVAIPPADVAVTKTANAAELFVGSNAVFTIVARNNGPGPADNVVVTDVLPAGVTLVSAPGCTGTTTLTCNAGTLAAGATATFTVTVTLPSTPSTVSNTATVSTTMVDPNSTNNSSTAAVAVVIPPADLSITKTANAPALFVNSNAIFTIVVRNNGPGPADNVVVTDTLPTGLTLVSAPGCTGTTTLTCNAGTLAPGATATFTITVTLPSTPGDVSNTATVASPTADSSTANNTSRAPLAAVAIPAGIPTLSTWGLLLLIGGLAAAVALRIR